MGPQTKQSAELLSNKLYVFVSRVAWLSAGHKAAPLSLASRRNSFTLRTSVELFLQGITQKNDCHSNKYLWHCTEKNGFVTATKLGVTNYFFVAATKNFAAATKRFVDRTKHFVVVTKDFCYPYFNKWFCWYNKTFYTVWQSRCFPIQTTAYLLK